MQAGKPLHYVTRCPGKLYLAISPGTKPSSRRSSNILKCESDVVFYLLNCDNHHLLRVRQYWMSETYAAIALCNQMPW